MPAFILQEYTAAAIIRALERHFLDYAVACVATAGGVLYEEKDELTWLDSRTALAYFSGVFRSRLSSLDPTATIERLQAYFHARGQLMVWWITPSTRPLDMDRYLEARGMRCRWRDVGMACRLATIRPAPALPGVTVELVRDAAVMEQWFAVFCRGFALDARVAAEYRRMVMSVPPARHPIRFYLARLDGCPAGTSALFYTAGVAGINEICTLPSLRRRGIGLAVTLAPLLDARTQGYQIAVLQASGMGEPLYRRLGFTSYCTFAGYVWQSASL